MSKPVRRKKKDDEAPICGVIMPISTIGDCSESHWRDVRDIIYEAVKRAGFTPNLVSEAQDIGVIQKRIVQNIYANPIVVCDVSCKNANVMFELGMRLAFDKPAILIKDDKTDYNFDTNSIEHLVYRRDLRFADSNDFIDRLAKKIESTHKASQDAATYTTFLKHFGSFTVPKIETKEVSQLDYLIEEVQSIKRDLNTLRPSIPSEAGMTGIRRLRARLRESRLSRCTVVCLRNSTEEQIEAVRDLLQTRRPDDLYVHEIDSRTHIHFSTDGDLVIDSPAFLSALLETAPTAKLFMGIKPADIVPCCNESHFEVKK